MSTTVDPLRDLKLRIIIHLAGLNTQFTDVPDFPGIRLMVTSSASRDAAGVTILRWNSDTRTLMYWVLIIGDVGLQYFATFQNEVAAQAWINNLATLSREGFAEVFRGQAKNPEDKALEELFAELRITFPK